MFRFGGELYFVGVASCARTAEEGRTRAFEAALTELRGYAQDRDTSRLLVATQMIYEEPNSPLARTDQRPSGACSAWINLTWLIYQGYTEKRPGDLLLPLSPLPIFLLLLNVRNHSFKT